jgi:hypothetical protein
MGPAEHELEARMRAVLLAFALTSNGATASWDPAGSGDGSDIPALGYGDAPHLYWQARWNEADDDQRGQIVNDAEAALDELLHSRGDRAVYESKADRDRRIVEHGEGIAAREVAIWARCGVRDVWSARAAAGRDTEHGRRLPVAVATNGAGRPRSIDTDAVARLTGNGLDAHQVADELGISYSSTLRALGRKS